MKSQNGFKFRYLLKSVLFAFIITIIMLLFFAILLRFTTLSETKLPIFNNITMIVSVVLASLYTGIKIKERGWLNGAIVGFFYYLVIIVINLIFIKNGSSPVFLFSKLVISTVTGFIGGMLGINLS